jgi:NAD(P)-dependent dehydrogenase (short-subunit alcohol dehydrogenase family)
MDLQLTGKRALVTGSSSGIGVGIAEMLAAEGASVVVHGRDATRLQAVHDRIAATGAPVALARGDLAIAKEAQAVAESALAAFGGIDILVNNVGGSSDEEAKSWFAVPLEEWTKTFEKNVVAAGRMIHAMAPAMKERGWGRIIQISSAAGTIPTSAQPDYGPAKAAMVNMSLGLSKALAKSGVTVNTVSPGMIYTEGLEDFLRQFAAKRGWGDDLAKAADYILQGTGQTVDRVGRVEDVAHAVCYLASPVADFVNGINIHMDGGGSSSIY